jgi:hypothetical protein
MSFPTVLRFFLPVIPLIVAIGTAAAQKSNPWRLAPVAEVPMPREKSAGVTEIEFGIQLASSPVPVVCGIGSDFMRTSAPTPAPQACFTNLNEMNLAWHCNGHPIASHHPVPMPRAIVEVIGDFDFGIYEMGGTVAPRTVFRAAPAMMPQLIVPEFPYPLADVKNHGGNCGWWLDGAGVPQARFAVPGRIGEHRQLFVIGLGLFGCQDEQHDRESGTRLAPPCAPAASPSCREKVDRLSGTWYREIEGAVFSATFAGDELKVRMTQCEDGLAMCFTVIADYAVTKDGIVHGVVTGVDVQASRGAGRTGSCALPTAALSAELQKLVDCPFSLRTRVTSAGVMVSNLKIALVGMEKPDLVMACGMFKHAADGKVPSPTPVKTVGGTMVPRGMPACGTCRDLPPTLPDVTPASYPPASSYSPPRPTNVPAGEFGMMAEVFGQMLGPKPQPLPLVAPPAPVPTMPVPTAPRIEKPR